MNHAFSLIELSSVIAILMILMIAGVSFFPRASSYARKTSDDLLMSMLDRARTIAITSNSDVILAMAEPNDLPDSAGRCRLALFKVTTWPSSPTDPIECILLSRWQTMESGIVLLGGNVDDLINPVDADKLRIRYGTSTTKNLKVHLMAFNSRGGLLLPAGSKPAIMRIAEGAYRNGAVIENSHVGSLSAHETRVKIGRIIARGYQING